MDAQYLLRHSAAMNAPTETTRVVITPDTDLSDFESFVVRLRLPDGTLLIERDLLDGQSPEIDLTLLNSSDRVIDHLDVQLEAKVVHGRESIVFVAGRRNGVTLLPGIRPVLVS
jgi:hypothetical protein